MKKTPGRKPRSSPAGRAVLKGREVRCRIGEQHGSEMEFEGDQRPCFSGPVRLRHYVRRGSLARYLKRDGPNLLSSRPPRIPANNRICIMDELNPKKAD